jgi:hypothetical protein
MTRCSASHQEFAGISMRCKKFAVIRRTNMATKNKKKAKAAKKGKAASKAKAGSNKIIIKS